MTPTTQAEQAAFDTEVAALYREQATAAGRIASLVDSFHRTAGDKTDYRFTRRGTWTMTDEVAEATARQMLAEGKIVSYAVEQVRASFKGVDKLRVQLAELEAQIEAAAVIYRSAPWPRFFLVTSSDGHIHSSMSCSTCYWTTTYGWLPQLSGLTEADAVAAHGTILCSVCYPTAPVEWTVGKAKVVDPNECPGTGQYAPADDARRFARYRKCPGCGYMMGVTSTGKIRRHKTPKVKA